MIYTSYFAKHKNRSDEDTAYISIAVGNPKYSVAYPIIDLKCLKPYGIFGTYEGEEYKAKYYERLDWYGVDYIYNEILRAARGKNTILLMCHEKDPNECHRKLFAEWWFMRTGEIIEEWGEERPKEEPNERLTQISFFDILE